MIRFFSSSNFSARVISRPLGMAMATAAEGALPGAPPEEASGRASEETASFYPTTGGAAHQGRGKGFKSNWPGRGGSIFGRPATAAPASDCGATAAGPSGGASDLVVG